MKQTSSMKPSGRSGRRVDPEAVAPGNVDLKRVGR